MNYIIEILTQADISKDIIKAICGVKRDCFFDPFFKDRIFDGEPLPIGFGEKSDHIVTLARMIELLAPRKDWRILEVGTGSGYSTAVCSTMVSEIVTIEYKENLAKKAKERVINSGHFNVRFFAGEATELSVNLGEFDGIIIYPACSHGPLPLLALLKENGRAVLPMGPPHRQQLALYTKFSKNWERHSANFKFFDFCEIDSIRGQYGWLDTLPVYMNIEENPDSESEKTDKDTK